jgi:hypothetical protein
MKRIAMVVLLLSSGCSFVDVLIDSEKRGCWSTDDD